MHPLREWLNEHDVTEVELAADLNCAQSTISGIVTGKRGQSYDLASRISARCGIPVDVLMTWRQRAAATEAA